MNTELAQVVEAAYSAFKADKPHDLGVCHRCCMEKWIEDDFLNYAPRELPLNYIKDWYFGAVAGGDGIVVHKEIAQYVIPKVLELLAKGKEPASVGDEVVLQRLDAGNKDRWSDSQNAVLQSYKTAYLNSLRDKDVGSMIDDVLCTFANAGFEASEMTTELMKWSDVELVSKLWLDWISWGKPNIWRTAFWDENTSNAKHVTQWYHSPELQQKAERVTLAENVTPEEKTKAQAVLWLI
ncbi:MAG: hypothetical protein GY952_04755 [Rhodobacteraceae bacterium]|nr:hypothetical protein [Paracoccaceae bacterium]